jgi:hypothetical protein
MTRQDDSDHLLWEDCTLLTDLEEQWPLQLHILWVQTGEKDEYPFRADLWILIIGEQPPAVKETSLCRLPCLEFDIEVLSWGSISLSNSS